MNSASDITAMFHQLRLPTIRDSFHALADRARRESWSYEKYLESLAEGEIEGRRARRIQRLLSQSNLPESKTLSSLDLDRLPAHIRPHLGSLLEGDFLQRAQNILLIGLPGRGKTHLACAIGRELILRHGIAVKYTTTFTLVQALIKAKAEHRIDRLLRSLDQQDLIIIDELGYVQQSREEMELLFTVLSERYERKSGMLTSNLVFSEWERVFQDPMMTAAAVDRLVHHSIILQMTGPTQRTPEPVEQVMAPVGADA